MRPSFPESGSEADFRQDVLSRLGKLERGSRGAISGDGTDTFLRSGNFIVTGGDIQVLDNGDVIIDGGELRAVSGATTRALLDRDRLRLNRTNGTRQVEITPAGGLKIYAANGTTERVVLDGVGLFVDGVQQPAIEVSTAGSNDNSGDTLTSTLKNLTTITFTLPSWADTVHWTVHNRAQLLTGATARTLRCGFTINDPNPPAGANNATVAAGSIGECTAFRSGSTAGTAVIRGWYGVDAGTESSHNEQLRGLAWFTRS